MTLTSLLEIKSEYLQCDDSRALMMAERLWLQRGAPIEPKALCDTLEAILIQLSREGIYYPKVLLLRKKELQRRTWAPKLAAPKITHPQLESRAGHSSTPQCERCGDIGIRNLPNGTGTICQCDAGEEYKRGIRKPISK